MARPPKEIPWDKWLRDSAKDPHNPSQQPGSLGMLTGQDARTLAAIARCWQLYAAGDAAGEAAALSAVRALLPALQPQCRGFARELIAYAMDWVDRERLWAEVCPSEPSLED